MPRYHPEILEALVGHGLVPSAETTPARLREAINDLYRYEIRRLRDRCRAGEFPVAALSTHVRALRTRYLLLSIPVDRWTLDAP
ncbi:MAG: hypothetical protein U0P30_17530 [Vicinamibacterales bacterium]